MTRLLPIFSFQDTQWSYVTDIPRWPGILVIILPCEVLVSALVSAILHHQFICYHILSKTNNVTSGDFHRFSAPWMIFLCTLSKLNLFSQSCHCRTFNKKHCHLMPQPHFCGFHQWSPLFVRILMIALQLIFVMYMILWRYRLILQGTLSRRKITQTHFFFCFVLFCFVLVWFARKNVWNKLYNDTKFTCSRLA